MSNKLIKCKTCGADMAKDAKVCPQCGAKNKSRHPVLGGFLLVIGLFLLIAAFGGSKEEPQRVNGSGGSNNSTTTSSNTTQAQTSFAIGETAKLNNVLVTMTEVKQVNGSLYNNPAEGNVFLICSFEIENNSSQDIAVSSLLSFDAYVDDYSTTLSLSALTSTDDTQLDGSVAAGKKMKGIVGYEVPANWKEFEINFTLNSVNGTAIKFVASNS